MKDKNFDGKCTYCNKTLRSKFGYSVGPTGLPQRYKCDRLWCTITHRIFMYLRRYSAMLRG